MANSSAFQNGMEEINNKIQITLILKFYHIFFVLYYNLICTAMASNQISANHHWRLCVFAVLFFDKNYDN